MLIVSNINSDNKPEKDGETGEEEVVVGAAHKQGNHLAIYTYTVNQSINQPLILILELLLKSKIFGFLCFRKVQ